MKKRLIKDPIWGNIQLFSWERALVNHFIFNRLHNVIQNSSGFRAYPGLKSSRFSHTIGVMHVATQLFVNAVANVADAASMAATDGTDGDADAPKAFDAFLKEGRSVHEQAFGAFEKNIDIYVDEILMSFPLKRDFVMLLAVLRVAALIHDIGHLPYSHIFENAVDAFLGNRIDGAANRQAA